MYAFSMYLFTWVFICCVYAITIAIDIQLVPGKQGHLRILAYRFNCEIPCRYSLQPPSPDAELYMVSSDKHVEAAINTHSNASIRIAGSMESPSYYPLLSNAFLKSHFNATATLSRESDIPWVMMGDFDRSKRVRPPTEAEPKATFVSKNCNPRSARQEYLEPINATVGIVSPGKCFHNADWPNCRGDRCSKEEFLRGYKLNIAFENSCHPEYISEKLYHAFEAGVLPVYMGSREVDKAAPVGSYVDVSHFDTPNQLAEYLETVMSNDTLYYSYFAWKDKPFDAVFEETNGVLWRESAMCRMCRYVDTLQRGLEWDRRRQRPRGEPRVPSHSQFLFAVFVLPVALAVVYLLVRRNRGVRLALSGFRFTFKN